MTMLDKIKALLGERGIGPGKEGARFGEREVATAALLIEAAGMDGEYSRAEHTAIADLLQRKFALDDEAAGVLIALAEHRQQNAAGLFRFTNAIKQSFDTEERVAVLEMLWEVVYADGWLDPFEDNLMRRIAGLLHIPDRERGLARQRVCARLGIS